MTTRRKLITSHAQLAALPARHEYVLTPGGYRHYSLVQKVPPKAATIERISKAPVVRKSAVKRKPVSIKDPASTQLHFNEAGHSAPVPNTTNPHWVAYASWVNTTGRPVFSIRASWKVPPAPTTDNTQTIFIFPGVQSAIRIVQPVLQWGPSFAGGGSFWAVSSWYAGDANTTALCSDLVPVNEGDTVTGIITLSSLSGDRCSYNCVFEGMEGSTALTVPSVSELRSVCMTLETYNINTLTDYPPVDKTLLSSIEVMGKSSPMPVVWKTPAPNGDLGEHALIANSRGGIGDVQLFY